MSSSERKQQIGLWAGQRGEAAVIECTEGRQVVPVLLGTIHGVVERRAGQTPDD
jgi:hypothetical protein